MVFGARPGLNDFNKPSTLDGEGDRRYAQLASAGGDPVAPGFSVL
jgi:hypothetical protein